MSVHTVLILYAKTGVAKKYLYTVIIIIFITCGHKFVTPMLGTDGSNVCHIWVLHTLNYVNIILLFLIQWRRNQLRLVGGGWGWAMVTCCEKCTFNLRGTLLF